VIILKKLINLYDKYKEIVNYLIFGFLTTVISLLVYYILTFTIINPGNAIGLQIANIISWIAGVIFAYITNREYVFNSKNGNLVKEIGSFVGARVVTLVMDMLIMFIGVTILRLDDRIFKLISQVVVIGSNYLFSKIFVFRKDD
jgi:putative flippase GtrA